VTLALAINACVNLIVGWALLLAWRSDRAQLFSRDLGWAFASQAMIPAAYLMQAQNQGIVSALGTVVIVGVSALYLSLLLLGSARLAGRAPTRVQGFALGAVLLLVAALLVPLNVQAAQAVSASLHVAAGLVATVWLWRQGGSERLAGLLLMLLGVNQFIFVFWGAAGIAVQATVAAMLRLTLGLALLHAAVRRSHEESGRLRDRFLQLTEHSHQGVAVVRGEDLLYANPALLKIYGLGSLTEVLTLWREATMPPEEREQARDRHRKIIAGELTQASWQGLRYRFDGTPIQLRFSAWRIDWDGRPAEQVVVTDETAQHDAAQAMLYQATHDELTGLPNRVALLQRLRDLCAAELPTPFALVLMDVDRFKLFNEAHGPSIGDAVLRSLSAALQKALAGRAEVMRLGEDEFALLAPGSESDRTAHSVAQAVRQLLMQPLALPQHEFFLDVSMGMATYPATAREPEALLRAANAAMHEAKRTPGTSVQFAEERFERGSGASLDAEQALRAGMKNDEFCLVYQPKVDAQNKTLVGFEALVRWDRPGLGRISPMEFIPAAERTGLIGPLGNLILTQACQQISEWRGAFGKTVPVAVNVSPLQLLDPGFPELVLRTLRHFDVPPALLTLEITESAAVTYMEQAREQIRQMRAHGVEVALDDFGTGFSSLNMLRSLPLRTVKIDRSLIDPMPAPDATAVVKAICDLASALRLDVVAEGVETREHARAATAAGCDVLQGYLYARPLSPDEAARWLGEMRSPDANPGVSVTTH